MFGVGFSREMFSVRHPSMGVSFKDLETYWKEYYPKAKEGLKTLTTTPIPGTTTQIPVKPATAPSSGIGSSTLLWVGGLAILGAGAYYFLADRPFGMRKK